MKKLLYIPLFFFCILHLSFLPIFANETWDDQGVSKFLEIYEKKISKDFPFESDKTELYGSFTKNGEPNVMVSVDFSKDFSFVEEDFQKLSSGGQEIYHSVDGTEPFWVEQRKYSSRSYGDCGDYRVSVDASITFLDEGDNSSRYVSLMDTYARDYLISTLKESPLCGVKEKSIFAEDIEIVLVKIEGDAEISKGGMNNFVQAKVGDVLKVGDYISTGFESTVEFKVKNIATLTVKEMTMFSVSQLGYDGDLAKTALKLRMGGVTTSVRPERGIRANFDIVTPTSTVGVRGTEFLTEVDEESQVTNVYVYEGVVSVKNNTTQEEVFVNANEKAYISSLGVVEISGMDVDMVREDSNSIFWIIVEIFVLFVFFVLTIVFFVKKKILLGIIMLFGCFVLFVFLIIAFVKFFSNSLKEDENISTPLSTNEFSIDLGINNSKTFFLEQSPTVYIACYKLTESLGESTTCPEGHFEIFRISLYDPDFYSEILSNPIYEDALIILEEFADGSAYVLEWPNGIYPQEIEDIGVEYFNEIADTFQLLSL